MSEDTDSTASDAASRLDVVEADVSTAQSDIITLENQISGAQSITFVTEASATSTTTAVAGDHVRLTDKGLGLFKYTASVVADGFSIITAANSLFLVYVPENFETPSEHFGIVAGTGQTPAIQALFRYAYDNNVRAILAPLSYDVNANLITENVVNGHFKLDMRGAVLNYVGAEISRLFQLTEIDSVDILGGTIEANDLIANPLDLERNTGIPIGSAKVTDVIVKNTKQTTVVRAAIAILVSGSFNNITIEGCEVDGVSRVTTSQACGGISVTQVAGFVKIARNKVSNVSTPDDKDADGIACFGTAAATITTYMGATVEMYSNVLSDCEGRFIKLQMTNSSVTNNVMKLSSGFSTITQWRGIDLQSDNGDVHHNSYRFGSGITFGTSSNLVTAQNVRNDGGAKVTHIHHNRCTTDTIIPFAYNLLSNFGTSTFIVADNTIDGATINEFIKHRVTVLATTDKASVLAHRNTFGLTTTAGSIYEPFDNIDMGDKLYVELIDNRNVGTQDARLFQSSGLANFAMGENFIVRNNSGVRHNIPWSLDMDNVLGGNTFYTSDQTVLNKATGMTTFFWVDTRSHLQYNTNDTLSLHRNSLTAGGAGWSAWV